MLLGQQAGLPPDFSLEISAPSGHEIDFRMYFYRLLSLTAVSQHRSWLLHLFHKISQNIAFKNQQNLPYIIKKKEKWYATEKRQKQRKNFCNAPSGIRTPDSETKFGSVISLQQMHAWECWKHI